MRAVFYLRLSSTDDASTSIVRQAEDLRALAAREGWEVVRELADDGISGRKARANAAEALRMLREGEADVLACYALDRWSRQGLRAVADLIDVLDARPGTRFRTLRDGIDSTSPAWRLTASVLSEVARIEAENTSARNRSSRAHLPRVGRFGGGVAPFGYRSEAGPGGVGRVLVPNPHEAPIVRELAERLLSGASVGSIARDLNARGIPTARSPFRRARDLGQPTEGLDRGSWATISVRRIMTSDTLLGRLTEWHRPDAESTAQRPRLLRDADGKPLAPFEPILDLATLTRLRDRLGTLDAPPLVRAVKPGRMLSGLAFCGLCGRKLYVRGGQARPAYRCSVSSSVSCPGVQVDAVKLEDFVVARYLGIVGAAPEVERTELVLDAPGAEALAEVEAALRELSTQLLSDDADEPVLLRRMGALKRRRTELRALKPSVEVVETKTGRTLSDAWHASLTTADRLALLSDAIEHVEVRPTSGPRGRGPLDPERVTIRWVS